MAAFEWDDAKSARCLEERGFGFEIVEEFEFATAVTVVEDRRAYGEPRFRSLGIIAGALYAVVWTRRGDATPHH